MSIIWEPLSTYTEEEREALEHFIYAPLSRATCFYCGREFLSLPVVQWMGAGSNVFLHWDCAKTFGRHLINDGERAEAGRR